MRTRRYCFISLATCNVACIAWPMTYSSPMNFTENWA